MPKGEARVYNFTVQRNHNYFVGRTRLLTHNSCGNARGPSPALEEDPYHPESVAGRQAMWDKYGKWATSDEGAAHRLGYEQRIPPQKLPFDSRGQDGFSNGKNVISRDIDGHNVTDGWKMFDRSGNRLGTYGPFLNYIKK